MMTQEYALPAEVRPTTARRVRRQENIPGVLYGPGIETQSIQVNAKSFAKIWHQAGSSSLLTITLGNKKHPVLIHDVQLHPLKGHPIHIDLYRVNMNEAIETAVPLTFTGEAPAVKDLSGILVRNMDALEIEALPKDLPHEIIVDISALKDFDAKILVSDLRIPEGVIVRDEAEKVVALVQPPRSEEELEELKTEVKEDVTAVEGVVKPEKPEEGEEKDETKSEKPVEKTAE